MIIDSGAARYMSGLKHFFTQYNGQKKDDVLGKVVTLGDGSATIPIQGSGTI